MATCVQTLTHHLCSHRLGHLGIYEEVWSESEEEINDDVSENDEPLGNENGESPASVQRVLCDWLVKFLVHVQVVFHISDVVMGSILKFLAAFLTILGKCTPQCAELSTLFPPSIMKLKSYTGIQHLSKLKKYVVCCKCHQTYEFKKCFQGAGASLRSKSCTYREFLNHPHLRMRMPCGTPLLKSVELSGGRKVLYPFLTYCFMGINLSLAWSVFLLKALYQYIAAKNRNIDV